MAVLLIRNVRLFDNWTGLWKDLYPSFTAGSLAGDWVGGDFHRKVTGVLVRNFERNPLKVPDSRFAGMDGIYFHP